MIARASRLLLVLILTMFSSSPARCQDFWFGGSGLWSNPSNWSAGVPGDHSVVVVNVDKSFVNLDVNPTINSLYLGCVDSESCLWGYWQGPYVYLSDYSAKRTMTVKRYLGVGVNSTLQLTGGTGLAVGQSARIGGSLLLSNGSQLEVGHNLFDRGYIETTGGQINVNGTVVIGRTGTFVIKGVQDAAYVGQLNNLGAVTVAKGAALNVGDITNLTDVPGFSSYDIAGTFASGTKSAFANLNNVDGGVDLENSQVTNITPVGGSLYAFGQACNPSCRTLGGFWISNSSTVNLTGTAYGIFGIDSGSTMNVTGDFQGENASVGGTLNVGGTLYGGVDISGTVNAQHLASFSNQLYIRNGATLNLTNQPGGVINLGALDLAGQIWAGSRNGLYQLTTVDSLKLESTEFIVSTPVGGTLTDYGDISIADGAVFIVNGNVTLYGSGNPYYHYGSSLNVAGGAHFNTTGNLTMGPYTLLNVGDTLPGTAYVGGTLTNSTGQITLAGFGSTLITGGIQNGGQLNLGPGTILTSSHGFFEMSPSVLGESIASNGFSVIIVSGGDVSLDGTLKIMLAKGFDPAIGSTYDFLLFDPGSLSGAFSKVVKVGFNKERWQVNYNNSLGMVQLEAVAAPEPTSMFLLGGGLVAIASLKRRYF